MGSLKNDSAMTRNRFAEVVGREPRPVDETLRELHGQMK
jgi:predicted transcriptional regulator